jgi:hypothetical protein
MTGGYGNDSQKAIPTPLLSVEHDATAADAPVSIEERNNADDTSE